MEKYLYKVFVNQRAVVELGLDVDFIDMAIFDYIKSFALSSACMKVNTEEGIYYWVSHKNIMEQMPMLDIKTDRSVLNRVNKLVDAGLLKKHPDCDKYGKTLYAFGEMYDLYEGFRTPENNFRDPRKIFQGNINTNTNNIPSVLSSSNEESNTSPNEETDPRFEHFWEVYDKKVEKPHTLRMWKKLKESEKKEILEKVALYVLSTPDKQYRMNPATYINPANKRWQDEIRTVGVQNTNEKGMIVDGKWHPVF